MMNLAPHVRRIMRSHSSLPAAPINAVRLWDKHTPYFIHPLWCATTLLTETTLPQKLRRDGALALLYHDVLEDTKDTLPKLTPRTVQLIHDMTYDNIDHEMLEVWKKEPFVLLLKLYDKISNMLDGAWMTPEKWKQYVEYTKKLATEVENHFGKKLNILTIAKAMYEKA